MSADGDRCSCQNEAAEHTPHCPEAEPSVVLGELRIFVNDQEVWSMDEALETICAVMDEPGEP